MDVRIGSIDATIVDTGATGTDRAMVERIVKQVITILDARRRSDERAKKDRSVAPPDADDVEDYG